MTKMFRKNTPVLGMAALLLLILAAGMMGCTKNNVETEDEPHALSGIHYNPPRDAPDFIAKNQSDMDYTFSKQPHPLRMVFFGYVSCLDVCPTNLKRYEKIQEIIGHKVEQVQFVFVTIDPERETPAVMKEYLSNYKGEIIGVSGTSEMLEPVYESWGVWREKVMLDEPVAGQDYKWDHTGQIFLVQGDKIRVSYPYGTGHEDMARDIEALLEDPNLGARLPNISEIRRVTLPPGAYALAFQKKPTIPTYIRVRVGDALVWRNDDYMYHFVGDMRIAPGQEATQVFTEPGEIYMGCTATPEDKIRIVIFDKDSDEGEDLDG